MEMFQLLSGFAWVQTDGLTEQFQKTLREGLIAPKVVDYQCKLVESLGQLLGDDVARLCFVKSFVFFSFPFISSPRFFPQGGNLLRGLPV